MIGNGCFHQKARLRIKIGACCLERIGERLHDVLEPTRSRAFVSALLTSDRWIIAYDFFYAVDVA